ncbi:sensor domain-containing diguanylate cyclase [Alkalibacterium sp.]|nr:MAG: diguanylate cyclase [Alkalibacterium sp.]
MLNQTNTELTREELMDKIEAQNLLINELLAEKEAEVKLDYPWKGNLGHWYWNIQSNDVVFNPLKVTALGYSKDEIPEKVPYEFFTDKLHPDDYITAMDKMMQHLKGETPVYEIEYRIKAKDGKWKWFYDRGKVTQREEDGTPLFASGIVFDVTSQKEKEENLEELTSSLIEIVEKDELTEIRNRRSIFRELKAKMMKSSIEEEQLVIAMLDIDDFKRINDTKGHVYGDYVLKEVAKSLSKTLTDKGCVGRYGGEEFLVILPLMGRDEAEQLLNSCREAVIFNEFLKNESITISGGYTLFDHHDSHEEFIDEADNYLYQAKRSGKNKIVGP